MVSVKKVLVTARQAVIGVLASTVIGMPVAFSDFSFSSEELRPYFGVGAEVLELDLQNAYGRPLFKGAIPGGMAFAGTRFGRYFGAEVGYNYFSRNGYQTLNANDTVPGFGQPLINFGEPFIVYKNQMLIRDVNLALTGYLPLEMLNCVLSRTELFGTVGVARTSVKARLESLRDADGVLRPGLSQVYSFRQKKTIPFVRVGLQQNITDNIHVSVFSEWKGMKSFKIRAVESARWEIRLRNSMNYGLRLGYTF